MSEPRQFVREYLRATEVLLKKDDLTEAERQAIQGILNRLSQKLLDPGFMR